ncbi:hypothetical protein [Streptomyces megasporus]|uniref:hypothetical protein n=1 Tax=Streptomyces megasporus TaxID=44060 RepID=UPI0009987FE5|nr:hypothetical protein [Streptomyces megasporus]
MNDQRYPQGRPHHPLPSQQPYDAQGPYGSHGSHGGQGPYGSHGSYGSYGDQGQAGYGPAVPDGSASPPPQYPGPVPPGRDGISAGTTAPAAAPAATATVDAPSPAAHRTGDPIIAPGLLPAALTTVLAVLLAVGARLPSPVTALAVVLLQAVTAAGWYRLNGMWPARQGIALAFLGGVTADVALLTVADEHAPVAVVGTLGVWCVLVLTLQLRNHSSPDERLYALTAGVASTALAVLAAGHLAAEPDAVTVGALAVAAATLARALPLPGPVSLLVAVAAAAGAGIAAGEFTSLGTSGAVLGSAAGVCALIGLRVASYDFPSRFVHMTAGVALPLTAAVPAVYLLGRALA